MDLLAREGWVADMVIFAVGNGDVDLAVLFFIITIALNKRHGIVVFLDLGILG